MEEKQKRIRGKKLNATQRKRLAQEDFTDEMMDQYLLHKIYFTEEGDPRRLTSEGLKTEIWVLIHRETGRKKEIIMG